MEPSALITTTVAAVLIGIKAKTLRQWRMIGEGSKNFFCGAWSITKWRRGSRSLPSKRLRAGSVGLGKVSTIYTSCINCHGVTSVVGTLIPQYRVKGKSSFDCFSAPRYN